MTFSSEFKIFQVRLEEVIPPQRGSTMAFELHESGNLWL